MQACSINQLCRYTILILLSTCALPICADTWADHFNAAGYRNSHYRAPTPSSTPHGRTVGTRELRDLIARTRPALIDVQAVPLRPETLEFGISWLPSEPRYHVPESVWLPNVGYGHLDETMERYFRTNLARATDRNLAHPIVLYCVVDCWMSWNAVKRAASYGYKNIYWYPEGTDGWAARRLPLVRAEPVPLEPITHEAAIGCGTIGDH